MKKGFMILLTFTMAFSLLFISCGGGEAAQNGQSANSDSSSADSTKKEAAGDLNKKADTDLIPVEISRLTRGEISSFILLSSNLETEIQADVFARAQGIVETIFAEEGQQVKKGEVMIRLEAREYEIAANKAQVEYKKQQSNFKRLEVMHDEKLLSDEEFEQARYSLDAAKYTWEDAQLRLDYMSIRSPINGWVGERLAKIGKRIQPTDKLFSVVNNSEVIAVVYVPEKNLNDLKINQPALVSSENLQGETFRAWIKRISPVVDPSSGTFKVTVGVENKNQELKPGMFVNVHLIIDVHKDAILIPKTAVVYENEYMNVFVVKDSLAHKFRLKPGFENSETIEALNDFQVGDQVIVVGQSGMKDKTKVKVVAERKARSAGETAAE